MAGQIVVVRHGETEWSASGRHTSATDLPLTEEGRRLAGELALRLQTYSFSAVLSSPLRRARETCELSGYGARAQLTDDLKEWSYGEYEGLTTPEIRQLNPDWVLWRDGCPGGETPAEVGARADRVLDGLRVLEGNALVFAHGHILRVLTARWLEMEPAAGSRLKLSAGGVSVLAFERDTAALEQWNWTP
ncbi:MAG: histidine phosphatase family protein [Solirubrobacteraceae bacterium]